MKKLFLALLLMISMLNLSYANEDTDSAQAYLKNTLDGIITTLKTNQDLCRDHEKMDSYVVSNILPKFDMETLYKSMVGEPAWSNASSEDKTNLTNELNTFFTHLFSKTLAEYDNQTLSFDETASSADGTKVAVKGKVHDPKDETVPFNFKVVKTADGWKVYNVILGGVDLTFTYRSNFKSIVESGGVAKLASELHSKNQQVAAIKK